MKKYYEVRVKGVSITVVSDTELDDDDVIMLAYEEGKLEGDDCHHVEFIKLVDQL